MVARPSTPAWVRNAWNLLAFLVVGPAGLFGFALARWGQYPALAGVIAVLAGLSWGFYPRRFASWRTVVGWAYTGLSLGILGGIGSGQIGAGRQAFWVLALGVMGAGVLLLLLPDLFNSLFWTAALLRAHPAGWSRPEAQSREEVLAASPFTLHEVVKVTEQLDGGMVQQSERRVDRLECRYRGEAVKTGKLLADLEGWTLERYRQYRTLRRLPVSLDVSPPREVTREEDQELELYSSPQWHAGRELSLQEALLGSPFGLWVRFLNAEAEYAVTYIGAEAGRLERRYQYLQGHDYDDLGQEELEDRGLIVERVTLRLASTGRVLSVYSDLGSAEAEIWARYRAQRREGATQGR